MLHRLFGRALAQHQVVRIAGSSLPLHPWDLPHSPEAIKTDPTEARANEPIAHEHTEPNCYEWSERCALNKHTDNKNAKKNRNISEQQCDEHNCNLVSETGNNKQTPRSDEIVSPGYCQNNPQTTQTHQQRNDLLL